MSWVITPSFTQWTPALITTALWLDAADASTVTTVSGAVSQWNDKSGNGRNCVQSNASFRPTYTSSAINSRSAIAFNVSSAAGHFLDGLTTASLGLSSRSMFCVFQATTGVNSAGILVLAPLSGNDYEQTNAVAYETSSGSNIFSAIGSTGISYGSAVTGTRPSPLGIYGEVFSTTTGSVYKDGTLASTDSSFTSFAALSAQGYLVGARFTGSVSTFLRGRVAEIVYTNSSLSTLNRQKLEGYLAHKWGLTANLPNDHPYKTVGPTP